MNATENQSCATPGASPKGGSPKRSRLRVTITGPRRRFPFLTQRTGWWLAAGLGVVGLLTPTPTRAQTNSTPQILFLHLKLTNQTVTLVDSVTRPGVLKPPRDAAVDDLHYELFSASSASLWKAAVANPSILHLEYEEPPGSGQLKRKTVVLDEAEFTARVPLVPEAKQIEFYRLEPSVPNAKGERALTRRSLGTLRLP